MSIVPTLMKRPISRPFVSATAAVAVLLAGSFSAQAAAPRGKLWSEKPVAKPLNPDAPVSMRAFAQLAKDLGPTVVNIMVRKKAKGGVWGYPAKSKKNQSLGSGFIINKAGYALTNNHVVEGAAAISVKLKNGNSYSATIVGTDPKLDVALLKFTPKETLTVAPLADSTKLEIGEWVIAIGNPFGLNHTVTAGIVSAMGRRDVQPGNRPMYSNFIQTDASINPGNSGGPLINIRGEVVGINTAINSAGQGIGFAVPINMVKTIIPQLATGKVQRSFLGVRIGPVPAELAQRRGLKRPTGALVHEVIRGTPAAAAGVKAGDIITHWDNKPIQHWGDLPWLASTAGARRVNMRLKRRNKPMTLAVVLKVRSSTRPAAATKVAPLGRKGPASSVIESLGIRVMELPRQLRSGLRLSAKVGVIVAEVDRGSSAFAAGLEAGDIIVAIDHKPAAANPAAVRKVLQRIARGGIVALNTVRGDREIFVTFKK